MTDADLDPGEDAPIEHNRIFIALVGLGLAFVISTAVIITIVALGNAGSKERDDDLANNHKAQICVVRILRQISASGGTTEQERRDRFAQVYAPAWLIENCGLTEAEAKDIQNL